MSYSKALKPTEVKVKKECKNGDSCEHLKMGWCKFSHSKMLKTQPVNNTVVKTKNVSKPLNTAVWQAVKSTFIPKLLKVQDSVKRATALNDIVVVDSKDSKDQKGSKKESWADMSEELSDLTQQMSMLKTAARAALGNNKCKTVIYASAQSVTAGAGAALSTSVALCPSTSAEWTALAALYDECRVSEIKVQFAINIVAGSGSGTFEWAVGYDSTRNVAPTTQADVMESMQHKTGIFGSSLASTVTYNATPTGYQHFDIKQQKMPVANASPVTGGSGIVANFPGEWFETNNAASTPYSVGYLRVFCSLLATCAIQIKFNLAFYCEFRERT